MAHKTFSRVEIKDADKGEVTAVFATLNVIDSDGDVTLPGAFENGAKVAISAYGHTSWQGALPVGKGSIREVKDEAVFEGRFFMDTVGGADTFATVKALAEDGLGEWSYGYDPVEFSFGEQDDRPVRYLAKQKVYEVSPVLLGAGVNTRTLTAKSGLKFSEHVESVVADVDALISRAAEVVALRAEKGKGISTASTDLLGRLTDSLKRLQELVTEPPPDTSADEFRREYARFVDLTRRSVA
jgi:hypothetical protein